ncbi:mCG65838 [Mus musculus]|nr:mCG65838 [Mus musculus]
MARQWWRTPLIPALGRQRQRISEFEDSLVYKAHQPRTEQLTVGWVAPHNQQL